MSPVRPVVIKTFLKTTPLAVAPVGIDARPAVPKDGRGAPVLGSSA